MAATCCDESPVVHCSPAQAETDQRLTDPDRAFRGPHRAAPGLFPDRGRPSPDHNRPSADRDRPSAGRDRPTPDRGRPCCRPQHGAAATRSPFSVHDAHPGHRGRVGTAGGGRHSAPAVNMGTRRRNRTAPPPWHPVAKFKRYFASTFECFSTILSTRVM